MALNWYVIRAISGKENKIKTYLEKEITRNSLEKFIPCRNKKKKESK